jgi:tetratricopeptide (TPR) repeat protein
MRLPPIISLALVAIPALAAGPSFVGSKTCSPCHRQIATPQTQSNMALTWQGTSAAALPAAYRSEMADGSARYTVARKADGFEYSVQLGRGEPLRSKVETIVGGRRHGLSFLVRVPEIGGLKLERAPLIEARYLHYSASGRLVLSPGFPEDSPTTWETAAGRVLSPDFERKCLNCHGAAQAKGAHETGVRCETCHGPGSAHLKAVGANAADKAIINPKRFTNEQVLEQCAQCHAGFGDLYDPLPEDLLISNQVNALRNSQCYIQSGAGLSCTTCHNPHQDASRADARPLQACLGCHGEAVQGRAGLCPVNKAGDCLKCHMPEQQKGSFHMVDHWIRVHPEQGIQAGRRDPKDRTHVRPKRLYLRLIVASDAVKAEAAHTELVSGVPFFSAAQKYSVDESRITGGYLGEMAANDLEPGLARAAFELERGEFSEVLEVGGKFMILYRMPRDFRYQAEQLELEATRLRDSGKFDEAAAKYQESLQVYPRFLRSLIFLGVTLGQKGEALRAAAVLSYAARLYPDDPAAHYNLAIAYGALGRTDDEIRSYERAIQLQPDLIPAYLNLGSTFYAADRLDEAAGAYRRGLLENPLTAALYFNLAQVYARQGKADEAKREAALAAVIDPKYAKPAP